jgi:uncharacterized protein (DUF697 family)
MRLKITCVTVVLIICSLSGGAVASADTMVITYRSGKVQHVVMDEPSAEVQNIGYHKVAVPLPEIRTEAVPVKQSGTQESVRKEQSPASKKQGVIIEWAPPIDQ